MIEIKIFIDIENHKEIVKSRAGAFSHIPGFIINKKVEEEIKNEIKKALNKNLKNELIQRGVEAEVSIN